MDKWDCSKCKEYGHYKERGCDGGDEPKPFGVSDEPFILSRDLKVLNCPFLVMYNSDVVDALELYFFYKKGILYEAGGIGEQPLWYFWAMQTIDNKVEEWQTQKLSQVSRQGIG